MKKIERKLNEKSNYWIIGKYEKIKYKHLGLVEFCVSSDKGQASWIRFLGCIDH